VEADVTREEKDQRIRDIISRYDRGVGALIVGDDVGLCRLLYTLGLEGSDKDVGDHLCSYLVA
jgi:hypothetical protein